RILACQPSQPGISTGDDRGEGLVDFMSDRRRHRTDGHLPRDPLKLLLSLPQAILGVLLFRFIPRHGVDSTLMRHCSPRKPAVGAILPAETEPEAMQYSTGSQVLGLDECLSSIIWVDHPLRRLAEQLRRMPAECSRPCWIDFEEGTLKVADHQQVLADIPD